MKTSSFLIFVSYASMMLPAIGFRLRRDCRLPPAHWTEQEVLVRSSAAGRRWTWILFASLCLLGLGGLAASLVWEVHPGEILMALMLLCFGLLVGVRSVPGLDWSILANEHGIAASKGNDAPRFIPWDELAGLSLHATHLRFTSTSGTIIRCTWWFPGVRQLVDQVRKYVSPAKWRQWRPRIEGLHRQLREAAIKR